ncbi:hypothetical protein AAA799E16_01245 [Marine Group I thaumarchaeote SCGC AAA799-E16]|uniref:Uncharacterized protein n=4 Tax=Marine Group I TaxID=905826 RepID=A0A087S7M1_9ARCH|nr:hypothetical protein AAA799N04_00938 [Marine Group I thaumarchaeote SCGC AAA799-N04]KER06068.1 hypothetical protein AAA799E16_01245 [Marine Group I thaumarchaeote SCGC AAA799-E16]KFM18150.1 hypothetical protein SCCGRSA3_01291 [Marine Group I thaumarchaeote SCGC RSA3]KFM21725.1 hypothetical protein AAA799B03_00674 [Marine Group I thaumarchaeote SCGC AAA799-B03]
MSQYEPNLMMHERERILLEHIKENPSLHHNALLKLVVPKFMAKTTFEKTRDSLIDKEIIYTKTEKNMKFYHVTENYTRKAAQHIEQTTNNSFHDLKIQIKRLETDFPHKDIDEKIHMSNSLLHRLLQTDNGFTILDSIKNPKKTLYRDEHLTIQQLIFQVYETIQNDKDSELLIPTITSFLGVIVPKNSLDK